VEPNAGSGDDEEGAAVMDDALSNGDGAAGSPWLASDRWVRTVVEEGRGREEEEGATAPRLGFLPNGPCHYYRI